MKTSQRHFFYKGTITGLVLLSVIMTACSSTFAPTSSPQSSTPLSPTIAAPPSPQRQSANGNLDSVSGHTLELITPQGRVTVNVSSNTIIENIITGTPSDLSLGQSVVVAGTIDSSGNIAATNISIRPQGQNTQFPSPSGAIPDPSRLPNVPGNGTGPGTSGNASGRGFSGTLTSINGNILLLSTPQTSSGQTTVTVTRNTSIEKTVSGTLTDLSPGNYLNVFGTADSNGQINAISITDRPQGQVNGFSPIGG